MFNFASYQIKDCRYGLVLLESSAFCADCYFIENSSFAVCIKFPYTFSAFLHCFFSGVSENWCNLSSQEEARSVGAVVIAQNCTQGDVGVQGTSDCWNSGNDDRSVGIALTGFDSYSGDDFTFDDCKVEVLLPSNQKLLLRKTAGVCAETVADQMIQLDK